MYNFHDSEPYFYRYLKEFGNISPRTITNYISWLRFLSKDYLIGTTLSDKEISNILEKEENKRHYRNVYKKEKDLRNFYFALKKFHSFLSFDYSNYQKKIIDKKLTEITKNANLSKTEKESVVLSRIGQGFFRKQLIRYWNSCSLSNFDKTNILIASHIKPWKDSDNLERTDVYNGLLLLPNYDKLFDKGYITFYESGQISISKLISKKDRQILGLNTSLRLTKIEDKHKEYLNFHIQNCFIK